MVGRFWIFGFVIFVLLVIVLYEHAKILEMIKDMADWIVAWWYHCTDYVLRLLRRLARTIFVEMQYLTDLIAK